MTKKALGKEKEMIGLKFKKLNFFFFCYMLHRKKKTLDLDSSIFYFFTSLNLFIFSFYTKNEKIEH